MLENGSQTKYRNFDDWILDKRSLHNPVDMFGENVASLVEEEGSIFPISKDDVIRVEELYKCSDLGDEILGLNASNQRMHYNFGEFLTLEYHPTKTSHDIPDPSLSDDVEIFCDGLLGAADEIFPHEKSNISCSYKGDLVDNKSVNESSVAAKTIVKDKQWLKDSLCFGSEDLLPSNNDQSTIIVPINNQCSKVEESNGAFNDVFNFKKKPRIQRVKRKCRTNAESVKELFSEGEEDPKPEFSKEEENNLHVAIKRSRKPTRRYAEEIMEQDLSHRKKMSGASTIGRPKRQCCTNETFNGECIQVPFGEPVLSKRPEKVYQPKDLKKGNGHVTSNVDTLMEFSPIESDEDILGDDCDEEKMNDNTSRRKHHNYWSTSEVVNLVEGVSMFGPGRWTEIKKLMFNSSPSRTSVDLKDKWRNLIRASCIQPKRKREVDQRKKHPSQQVPESILRRVKELASTSPCPRMQPNQAPKNSFVASPIPKLANGICLAISSTVES